MPTKETILSKKNGYYKAIGTKIIPVCFITTYIIESAIEYGSVACT